MSKLLIETRSTHHVNFSIHQLVFELEVLAQWSKGPFGLNASKI